MNPSLISQVITAVGYILCAIQIVSVAVVVWLLNHAKFEPNLE